VSYCLWIDLNFGIEEVHQFILWHISKIYPAGEALQIARVDPLSLLADRVAVESESLLLKAHISLHCAIGAG